MKGWLLAYFAGAYIHLTGSCRSYRSACTGREIAATVWGVVCTLFRLSTGAEEVEQKLKTSC